MVERGTDEFVWDYEDRMVEATVNSVVTTFAYRDDGLQHPHGRYDNHHLHLGLNAGLPVVLDDGNQYVYDAGLSSMKQGGNWVGILLPGRRARLNDGHRRRLRRRRERLYLRCLRRADRDRRARQRV